MSDGNGQKPHLTNRMRLQKMAKDTPLVTGDEKIAVFGAGGQIGSKLRPLLDALYPGQVVYCEDPKFAKSKGMEALDITNEEQIRALIKGHNVKVVINLAALLSKAAEEDPDKALAVNFYAPLTLLKIAKEEGVRKVQMMSSIAAQEFDPRMHDSAEVQAAKKALRKNASTSLHAVPDGSYGLSKTALEMAARMFSLHYDLDVNIPRLAGVLNTHTPWPSNGTTEEIDKLVVAAAMQKVYGERWEEKLRDVIIARDGDAGRAALEKGHYIHDGTYVPEVPINTTFDMVDGRTLPEATLMLLHKDLRGQYDIQYQDAVHNVSEYTIGIKEAADILKCLNPDFEVAFSKDAKHGLDNAKMANADSWPASQDTTSTEALIGDFKQYTAAQSITDAYNRVVDELKRRELENRGIEPKGTGAARAGAA